MTWQTDVAMLYTAVKRMRETSGSHPRPEVWHQIAHLIEQHAETVEQANADLETANLPRQVDQDILTLAMIYMRFLPVSTHHGPSEVALAWHDVVCPEGDECRSRSLHASSEPIYRSGMLDRFLERLDR